MSDPTALSQVNPENAALFTEFCQRCAANPDLTREFDRLNKTNISQKGSPLDLAIDRAAGRTEKDIAAFVEFCADLWLRLPRAEPTESGGDMNLGTSWRRCQACGLKVWLTKRGKMCKHLPTEHPHVAGFAESSSGIPASFERCPGGQP